MIRHLLACALTVLLLVPQAHAWNYAGHRAITFLAYSHLNQKARARVDAILRAHPDYATIFSQGKSSEPWDVARNAFVTASTWPDIIRGDPRFSDDGSLPAPAGFPTSNRHTDWHYINVPYPARYSKMPVPEVNAVSQLPILFRALKPSGPVTMEEAFALPWILHIVTDLHQPLHAVTRFDNVQGKVEHDRGGNRCYVDNSNLHAYWDGLLGRDETEGALARIAASIGDETPPTTRPSLDPKDWMAEARKLAPTHVYSFRGSCADKATPVRLTPAYQQRAVRAARHQAAQAAYRVAAMLNERLGR